MDLSRRQFLGAVAGGAAVTYFGNPYDFEAEVNRVAKSLEKISKLERGLAIIGEVHANYGPSNVEFVDKLNQKIGIDLVFAEGAYDFRYNCADPYLLSTMDAVALYSDAPSIKEVAKKLKETSNGFYELRRMGFNIEGIEDRSLQARSYIIKRLMDKCQNQFPPEDQAEFRFLEDEYWGVAVKERNIHAAKVINQRFGEGKRGVLIIGKGHIKEDQPHLPKGEKPHFIQDLLQSDIKYTLTDITEIRYGTMIDPSTA